MKQKLIETTVQRERGKSNKFNTGTEDLNSTNPSDLAPMYRTFHTTVAEYSLFKCTSNMYQDRPHILGHKINLNKFKRIQVIQSIFSEQNGMKIENQQQKDLWKILKMFEN